MDNDSSFVVQEPVRTLSVALLLTTHLASAAPVPQPKLAFDRPVLTLAAAGTVPASTAQAIIAVIGRSETQLLACYKAAPCVSTVMAMFTIGADGKASDPTAAPMEGALLTADGNPWPEITDCIMATISKLEFAKSKTGQAVTVIQQIHHDAACSSSPRAAGAPVPASAPAPRLTFGSPSVSPVSGKTPVSPVETKGIATVIRRSEKQLLACYHAAVPCRGSVAAFFAIDRDGKVTDAATGPNEGMRTTKAMVDPDGAAWAQLTACITATLSKLAFPKPSNGQAVTVIQEIRHDAGCSSSARSPSVTPPTSR